MKQNAQQEKLTDLELLMSKIEDIMEKPNFKKELKQFLLKESSLSSEELENFVTKEIFQVRDSRKDSALNKSEEIKEETENSHVKMGEILRAAEKKFKDLLNDSRIQNELKEYGKSIDSSTRRDYLLKLSNLDAYKTVSGYLKDKNVPLEKNAFLKQVQEESKEERRADSNLCNYSIRSKKPKYIASKIKDASLEELKIQKLKSENSFLKTDNEYLKAKNKKFKETNLELKAENLSLQEEVERLRARVRELSIDESNQI